MEKEDWTWRVDLFDLYDWIVPDEKVKSKTKWIFECNYNDTIVYKEEKCLFT